MYNLPSFWIFLPKYNIFPIPLIKDTLSSSPLIKLKLAESKDETTKTLYLQFLLWPGRTKRDEEKEQTEFIAPSQYINKIYGKYFLFQKYKTYEELLNNGNIRKIMNNVKKDLKILE